MDALEHHVEDTIGLEPADRASLLRLRGYQDWPAACRLSRQPRRRRTEERGSFFRSRRRRSPILRIRRCAIIVKRYGAESTLGNFGVYVGNQEKGRVHAVAAKG